MLNVTCISAQKCWYLIDLFEASQAGDVLVSANTERLASHSQLLRYNPHNPEYRIVILPPTSCSDRVS